MKKIYLCPKCKKQSPIFYKLESRILRTNYDALTHIREYSINAVSIDTLSYPRLCLYQCPNCYTTYSCDKGLEQFLIDKPIQNLTFKCPICHITSDTFLRTSTEHTCERIDINNKVLDSYSDEDGATHKYQCPKCHNIIEHVYSIKELLVNHDTP